MLYKEASRILHNIEDKRGTVKNLVLSSSYKNKKELFALVCETLKYKSIIATILEKTKLQKHEKILKQDHLALVLVYDFLIGRGFKGHTDKFKDAIQKHQAALQSEFARLKVKYGAETNEDLLPSKVKNEVKLPRYVRVNTLKTTVDDVISHFRKDGFKQLSKIPMLYESYLETLRSLKNNTFVEDPYIPELLAFAKNTDLHDHVLYKNGDIIFQDRASCIPAFALNPPAGSHVIDCCAAPGNKTSHLAALMNNTGTLYAFDKDMKRAATLNTLLLRAGVLCATTRHADFLSCNPDDPKYKDVEYMLVDPSCSGSGIVSRQNNLTDDETSSSTGRLENLAKFQVAILTHAMSFPKVKRLVYSTCSVHQIENENVVNKSLKLAGGQFKLLPVLKDHPHRGERLQNACEFFKARRCLRLSPKSDLSNGFFVALMERDEDVEIGNVRKFKKVQEKDNVPDHKPGVEAEMRQNNKRPSNNASELPTKKPKRKRSKAKIKHAERKVEEKDVGKIVTALSTSLTKKKKKRHNRKHKPVTS